MSSTLEAKIVVLGAQGVGKTSLVTRYCNNTFSPSSPPPSTIGASFLTKRILDTDTDTLVRFAEMGAWLRELRKECPRDVVLHVVGTKADVVAKDGGKREVPFERCIAYVAENSAPGVGGTPPATAVVGGEGGGEEGRRGRKSAAGGLFGHVTPAAGASTPATTAQTNHDHQHGGSAAAAAQSPSSKRSSGFWGQEVGWDACHEVSAETGEGVEEVFRVVARKLVEQNRKLQQALMAAAGTATPGLMGVGDLGGGLASANVLSRAGDASYGGTGYFDSVHEMGRGSFRVGKDRRSWLFTPGYSTGGTIEEAAAVNVAPTEEEVEARRRGRCC